MTVIPFPIKPKPESRFHVLLWQDHTFFYVTIFDDGHEHETVTFRCCEDACAVAFFWQHRHGASVEDRLQQEGGAA